MRGIDPITYGIFLILGVLTIFYIVSGILKNASKMSWPALIVFVLIVVFAFRWCSVHVETEPPPVQIELE